MVNGGPKRYLSLSFKRAKTTLSLNFKEAMRVDSKRRAHLHPLRAITVSDVLLTKEEFV